MTAAQLIAEKTVRSGKLPPLDANTVEALCEEELTQLLARRFRVFTERGLHCHQALLLTVTPDR